VAKVLIDAPATNAKFPQAGLVSTMMWCSDGAPTKIPIGEKIEDMGARILGTAPPAKGTRFAVIDFPPGNTPHMHRTESVDYVIVMEGEIEMDMDDSTVKLKQGDIMIQRPTTPPSCPAAPPPTPGPTAAPRPPVLPSFSSTPSRSASATRWSAPPARA